VLENAFRAGSLHGRPIIVWFRLEHVKSSVSNQPLIDFTNFGVVKFSYCLSLPSHIKYFKYFKFLKGTDNITLEFLFI